MSRGERQGTHWVGCWEAHHGCAVERLRALMAAAEKVRDGFEPDPGTSDLDDEQPICLFTSLGAWRRLDGGLRRLK